MQRPASVTVFGILNIVFAAFGVFGIFMTAALLSRHGVANNPVARIVQSSPAYAGWLKLSIPLGMLGCAALLASGIGLLNLKNWARKVAIGYAVYALLFGLASVIVNFNFLFRPMVEEAAHKQGPEAAAAIGGAVGGTFGGCFGLIYPILLLIFMTRPNVRAAFQSPDAPPLLPQG